MRTASILLPWVPARADTITGRVVDASGAGVPGVDIDADNLGSGGDPDLFNDGTDASGFFTTTIPAGVYRLYFKPPPPPATTHLTAILDSVVVVGTRDLGVITLPPGVGVYGRTVDTAGFPIGGVKLAVTDRVTGETLVMNNAVTNAFGNFGVAAPAHDVYLDLDPIAVVGRTLVPQRLALTLSASIDLGSIVLADGFVLSGTFTDAAGAPVSGIDLDVFDSARGTKLFTPHDRTSSLGAFALVLAPGTYDLEACPPFAARLVAVDVEGFPFTGTTDVGTVPLQAGVVLSGKVWDVNGSPLAGIDLDVERTASGASVVTCGDNTNVLGNYAVVVPAAVLDIGFALPGQHGTSGEDLHTAVLITSDTVLDGVLPPPLPEFSGTPPSGPAPLTVAFSDLSSGAVTGWSWSFGDGGTSTLASPAHAYTIPGPYTVALTVSGPGGPNTLTKPGYVLVDAPPVAEFVGTPTGGIAPLLVTFTNQSTGSITAHAWTFGDGGTSTLASPAHTYATPGTYTVALTETGPGGSSTRTRTDYVVGGEPPPVAEFVGSPTSGVAPLLVTFTNQSTGSITAHAWSFGDGGTSALASPTHTYATPGTYTVALTETGPGGSSTRTRTDYVVVVEPPPVAEFRGSPLRGRAPLAVQFEDLSTGTVTSWSWSFGDLGVSSAPNPTHVYRRSGIYTVTLTVTGPGGTDSRTRMAYVLVFGPASGGAPGRSVSRKL